MRLSIHKFFLANTCPNAHLPSSLADHHRRPASFNPFPPFPIHTRRATALISCGGRSTAVLARAHKLKIQSHPSELVPSGPRSRYLDGRRRELMVAVDARSEGEIDGQKAPNPLPTARGAARVEGPRPWIVLFCSEKDQTSSVVVEFDSLFHAKSCDQIAISSTTACTFNIAHVGCKWFLAPSSTAGPRGGVASRYLEGTSPPISCIAQTMGSGGCSFLCISSSLVHAAGCRAAHDPQCGYCYLSPTSTRMQEGVGRFATQPGCHRVCQAGSEWRPSLIPRATNSSNESSAGSTDRYPINPMKQGVAQNIEQLWKEYFTDPTQWWDNRDNKRNPNTPDFKHIVTRKALWLDGWSTPSWVKEELLVKSGGKPRPQTDYCFDGAQDVARYHEKEVLPFAREAIVKRRGTLDIVDEKEISLNPYECCEILQRCSRTKDLVKGKQVHEQIMKSKLEQNSYVANHLVRMYAKCGRLKESRQVFDNLAKKDIFSWTSMIAIYAQDGDSEEAFKIFHRMVGEGVKPNKVIYVSILNACCKSETLQWGKEVHKHTIQNRLLVDVGLGTALVQMYVKCGSIKEARQVFDGMANHNVISWTVMIGAYAESGDGSRAFELFNQMRRKGFIPDAITYLCILNPCASEGALDWVKEVHADILEAGLESDIRVSSALVRMYMKSGSVENARQVFDKMTYRDTISWNVIIGGYAQQGHGDEAFRLFLQMQQDGFRPDAITYTSILNPCASAGALEWVKKVHAHACRAGFKSDTRVGNALVHMFAKSGSIEDAQVVFNRMVSRDIISWTVMIGGYASCGRGDVAFEHFLQMQREGFVPDTFVYTSILNPCASAGALQWVREVHGQAEKSGFVSDVHVGSALVQMYAKCGSIYDARQVFDQMFNRDVVSWNVMIASYAENGFANEAFELFLQMQREGFLPNVSTCLSILNPSASTGALEWVKEVHAYAIKTELHLDVRVGNALVQMYAKSGSIDDARLAFDRMLVRDVITWTMMIGGYAKCGCGELAFKLFLEMEQEGFVPDVITYKSILDPCASAGALEWVKEVHARAVKEGLESDVRVGNALVQMYAKSGSIDNAQLVFHRMLDRDVNSWNTMIGAFAESGRDDEAFGLFIQMQREGFIPEAKTYTSILIPCASEGVLTWVKEVHDHAVKAGLELDIWVGNALIQMYAKSGNIDESIKVFSKMGDRNIISWNTMIGAYAEVGRGYEAFGLFIQMQQDGFVPDAFTYSRILNPCASAGALEWVEEVHAHVIEAGLESDMRVGSALVHMYAKSGSIDVARQVFDRMVNRDVITWSAMIGGLAQHGYGLEALQYFERMESEGVRPNEVTFVAVLSACSHAGFVDKGWHYFLSLSQDYGLQPTMIHYTCMVDVLGRAGKLNEAVNFIKKMPFEADAATWGAVLGACKVHGSVKLAKYAAEKCLALKPDNPAVYVVLSNIYLAAGLSQKASSVRLLMKERGVKKDPGRSWIEVDRKVHHFVVGDKSHPETEEIYAQLTRLTTLIKQAGYVPDTSLVMQDLDEQQKEQVLCSHSEKLAIAYGLIKTSLSRKIRIFKNLRVCSDCHTATKFVSKVTGREIVARDSYRFHHFKDGVCSCGDYW